MQKIITKEPTPALLTLFGLCVAGIDPYGIGLCGWVCFPRQDCEPKGWSHGFIKSCLEPVNQKRENLWWHQSWYPNFYRKAVIFKTKLDKNGERLWENRKVVYTM